MNWKSTATKKISAWIAWMHRGCRSIGIQLYAQFVLLSVVVRKIKGEEILRTATLRKLFAQQSIVNTFFYPRKFALFTICQAFGFPGNLSAATSDPSIAALRGKTGLQKRYQ